MCKAWNTCCILVLVALLCIAVVAQQKAAVMYANGDVTVNGIITSHSSSVLVAGDKIAVGPKATATISFPGVPPATVKVGVNSTLVYDDDGLQLSSGAVLMASNGHTSVQLDGLTVSAPQAAEFLVTAGPARNISCLKGSCTVSSRSASVGLHAGQALVARAKQPGGKDRKDDGDGTQGQASSAGGAAGGTGPAVAATGGIPGWVIGVVAAATAEGIGTVIAVTQSGTPPSPSVP